MGSVRNDIDTNLGVTSSGNGGREVANQVKQAGDAVAAANDKVGNSALQSARKQGEGAKETEKAAKAQQNNNNEIKKGATELSKLASGISLINPKIGGWIQGLARMATAVDALVNSTKNIGKTLVSLGKTLITTPIGWAITAVTTLAFAWDKMSQSAEEARKENLKSAKSIKDVVKYSKDETEVASKLNELLSKQNELRKRKNDQLDAERKAQQALARARREAAIEEKKRDIKETSGLMSPSDAKSYLEREGRVVSQMEFENRIKNQLDAEVNAEAKLKTLVEERKALLEDIEKIRNAGEGLSVGFAAGLRPGAVKAEDIASVSNGLAQQIKALQERLVTLESMINVARTEMETEKVKSAMTNGGAPGEADVVRKSLEDALAKAKGEELDLEDERVDYIRKYNKEMDGVDKINHDHKVEINKAIQKYYQELISGAAREDAEQNLANAKAVADFKKNKAIEDLRKDNSEIIRRRKIQGEIDKLKKEEYDERMRHLKFLKDNIGKEDDVERIQYDYDKKIRDAKIQYLENIEKGIGEEEAKRMRMLAEEEAGYERDKAYAGLKAKERDPYAAKTFDSNSITGKGGFATKQDVMRSGLYAVDIEKAQLAYLQRQLEELKEIRTTVDRIEVDKTAVGWM